MCPFSSFIGALHFLQVTVFSGSHCRAVARSANSAAYGHPSITRFCRGTPSSRRKPPSTPTLASPGSLLVPVVQWWLLAGWYDRLISFPFHLAPEIRFCIQHQLPIRKQICARGGECFCRYDHPLLADTHAGAGSRLPGMGDHSRHKCCRTKPDRRDVPT